MQQSKAMKAFVGIPIKTELGEAWQAALCESCPSIADQIRWTRPCNFHLTVCFIGQVALEQHPLLTETIAKSLVSAHEFIININKISFFPKEKPKVVAALVDKHALLQQLFDVLNHALQMAEFKVAFADAYEPHITLGRLKQSLLTQFNPIAVNTPPIPVTQLILYNSKPTPSGRCYQQLDHFNLNSVLEA